MFINRLSESKSKTAKQCFLKYKYKYHDRYKEDVGEADHLAFGSFIHKVFELGYKDASFDSLMRVASNERKNYKFSEERMLTIAKCIRNFLIFNKPLGETLCTEYVYEVNEANDICLNGVIDRVVRGTNGGLLIIDYKTSKTESTKDELIADDQLMGYVYACSKKFDVNINNITASHYYPVTNNFVPVRFNSLQIAKYKESKIQEVWQIRKMKIEECKAKKNKFCNWCGYKAICPIYESKEVIASRIDEKRAASAKEAEEKKAGNKPIS